MKRRVPEGLGPVCGWKGVRTVTSDMNEMKERVLGKANGGWGGTPHVAMLYRELRLSKEREWAARAPQEARTELHVELRVPQEAAARS